MRVMQLAVGAIVLLLVAALCLVLAAPNLGYHYAVVESGSMQPTYPVGSVIVTRKVDPTAVMVGDVISWEVPDGPAQVITHRVIEVVPGRVGISFRTQGDANNTADGNPVAADSLRGRVVFSVPEIGYLVPLLQTKELFLALILIPSAILAAGEIGSILRELRGGRKVPDALLDGVIRDFEA